MNNPSDFDFAFEIGLKSAFTLPDFATANITNHKVVVTNEMVQEEISRMQLKAGKMAEKDEVNNEEDVVNVLFTESDENAIEIEGGITKENSVLVKYFNPTMQKQLMGKK